MKLKLNTLESLHRNLLALDGYNRAIKVDGKDALVFERHSYGAKFTWNRVKNLKILRNKLNDIDALRVDIAKRYLDKPSDEIVPVDKQPAFKAEFTKALEIVEDVKGLLRFPVKELNLFDPETNPNGNNIASTILDVLEPFIEDPKS